MALAACAVSVSLLPGSAPGHGEPAAQRQVAWLWDGSALPPPAFGLGEAAPVVRHLYFRGTEVLGRAGGALPRLPQGLPVTPVVHVEISTLRVPPLQVLEQHRQLVVEAVLVAARQASSGTVQLDLEARPSQRDYYLRLVRDIRAALPSSVRLSVTALAWWCRSPEWLDHIDADEVVPMFFRMGADASAMRAELTRADSRLHPRCRAGAAGFAMQEPPPAAAAAAYSRVYWFDYRRWRSGISPATPSSSP